MHVASPLSDAHAAVEQSDVAVGPFVLQGVDRIALGDDAVARTEDVARGDAVVEVERAVVAGVEHHHPGVHRPIVEVFDMHVHCPAEQRIGRVQRIGELAPRFGHAVIGDHFGLALFGVFASVEFAAQEQFDVFDRNVHARTVPVAVQVLHVGRAVVVAQGDIDAFAGHLLQQVGLHGPAAFEVVETYGAAGAEKCGQLFAQRDLFPGPGFGSLGVVAVAAENEQVVQLVLFGMGLHYLAQVGTQQFVGIRAFAFGRLDAGRVDRRRDVLARFGRERIVEIERFVGVAAQELELQFRIVVIAVGGDRRIFPVAVLTALERRCEMLSVADHGNGDVADEHHAFEVRLRLRHPDDLAAHAFGVLPLVDEQVGPQSVALHGGAVGVYLGGCGFITPAVDENGERRGAFHAGTDDPRCRCKRQGLQADGDQ